ncbi:MAG: hypothetical protein PHP42_02985 [Bacteroidota bacterium]|nr:hypothetical protein [Bacteroidota bacterium]
MNHIDQKILELYVLKDETVLGQREMIEHHLAECAGCRELYARMQDVYAGFFDTMKNEQQQSPALPLRAKKSLTILSPSPLQEIRANYEIERAPIQRAVLFAKRHPIVSSTISLFVLGFFTLLGLQVFIATEEIDDNPSYYRYSPDNKLEVYNKENKMLWALPGGLGLEGAKESENLQKIFYTQIVDINGDGVNEVISSLALGNENTYGNLKVYNHLGKMIKQFSFSDQQIHFQNLNYNHTFGINGFITFRSSLNEFNLAVIAGNGRSPNFIALLDSNLNILGKYWHFGNIEGITLANNKQTGHHNLILTGINDVDDMNFNEFSILIVLDPEKIVDNNESSATKGFGLNTSQSEVYYIRFPRTDIERTLKVRTGAYLRENMSESNLYVQIADNIYSYNPSPIRFEYIFSFDNMKVTEVKFNSPTELTHKKLKEEGKIHSAFDKQYLEDLRNGVDYWDGEKWSKKIVKVNQTWSLLQKN